MADLHALPTPATGPTVTALKLTAWKLQALLASVVQFERLGGGQHQHYCTVLGEMAEEHAAELVSALEVAEDQGGLTHG